MNILRWLSKILEIDKSRAEERMITVSKELEITMCELFFLAFYLDGGTEKEKVYDAYAQFEMFGAIPEYMYIFVDRYTVSKTETQQRIKWVFQNKPAPESPF